MFNYLEIDIFTQKLKCVFVDWTGLNQEYRTIVKFAEFDFWHWFCLVSEK